MSTRPPGWLHHLHHPRWARRLRHSLRMRLVLVFVVLGLAMSSVFVLGMQRALSGGWRELVRPLLSDYVDRLAADIGSPPDPARALALAERLPIWVQVRGPSVNFDTRGDLAAHLNIDDLPHPDPEELHGTAPRLNGPAVGEPRPIGPPLAEQITSEPAVITPRTGATPARDTPASAMPSEPRDTRRLPFRRPREPRGPGAWLLTRISADGHTLHFGLDVADIERRPRTIGWLTLVAILLLTLGAYAYVRRLLAPLADIGAGAQRYGGGDFATPIPVRRSDELGDLATQVNTMARDIHAMLDAKRALLLAISHELRSPLTRARLNAELVDEGPARDALMHDLAAMRDLITDLLESERLAAGHAALHCEPTDLGALLAALLAEHCPAAEIEMAELDQLAPLPPMPLDAPRLRLALRNLLVNAMRHGRRDGEAPRLQISLTPGPRDRQSEPAGHAAAGVWLTVRDFGPGVAPEQLDSLGQAFWRADTARQRSTGGVGLGLYLVRLVIEAHRGRLVFGNAAPGLRVEVWLPAAATD